MSRRAAGEREAEARPAALALLDATELDARSIVERALRITARICIYTNDELVIESLP